MATPPELNLEPAALLSKPSTLILHSRPYAFAPPQGQWGVENYLSGEAEWGAGLVLRRLRSTPGSVANYFDSMRQTAVQRTVFAWTDLASFFWWPHLPEIEGDFIELPPNYFPAAERIPSPEYEVE